MSGETRRWGALSWLGALGCLIVWIGAVAHEHGHGDAMPEGAHLGTVSFETTCNLQVAADFNRGISLLHSFWYDEANRAFEKVVAEDPGCAMGYWGQAMTHFSQINGWPEPADLKAAREALAKADAISKRSAREDAYIHALHLFYDDYTPDDPIAAAKRYAEGMSILAATFPGDLEASVFYALALLASETPGDLGLVNTRKAIAILNPLFATHPDHPGIAHYIIHACDTPELARTGLEAARKFAQIAPAAPHALHMPSHIFTRLGLWQEAIASNLASKAAAENTKGMHVGAENRLHAMQFLEYAYLQIGHDEDAESMVTEARTVAPSDVDPRYKDYYPFAQTRFQTLFALETHDWISAARVEPLPNDDGSARFLTIPAHAIAAGHLRDRVLARRTMQEAEAFMTEQSKGKPLPRAGTPESAFLDEIHGWTAFATGDLNTAIGLLRPLANREDTIGKGETDLPVREMIGDMLLLSGKRHEALKEYQLALKSNPDRFNELLGAGQAAEGSGDRALAASYYRRLLKNCDGASGRALKELEHARAVAGQTGSSAG